MAVQNDEGLRVDRWLWFVRFYKSRMLAATAVQAGHVRTNGERTKPGSRVVPGDTVELVKDRLPYKVKVLSLPVRRGPAAEAGRCYLEDPVTQNKRQEAIARIREDRRLMPRTSGRPDKHTRRMLRARSRGLPDS
jgi:ribosome-associated heat shock protein Hsp15